MEIISERRTGKFQEIAYTVVGIDETTKKVKMKPVCISPKDVEIQNLNMESADNNRMGAWFYMYCPVVKGYKSCVKITIFSSRKCIPNTLNKLHTNGLTPPVGVLGYRCRERTRRWQDMHVAGQEPCLTRR